MRALLLAACVLALAWPSAHAHVAADRPSIQAGESPRLVDAQLDRGRARFELALEADPLRHWVRHDVDPKSGLVRVEHREDASDAHGAAFAEWRIHRVLEYRDANRNLRYDSGDTVARSWRLAAYEWNATGPRDARAGGVPVRDVAWTGRAGDAPAVSLDAAAAGRDFVDEGARVRPQDLILYLDLLNFTDRGVGHLYAVEGAIAARAGAALAEDRAGNVTFGLHVDDAGRRAFLVWGGQATLDGREETLTLSVGEPADEGGNRTWPFSWSFPLFEREARMTIVSAIEYPLPQGRDAPAAAPGALLAALALAALAYRRR